MLTIVQPAFYAAGAVIGVASLLIAYREGVSPTVLGGGAAAMAVTALVWAPRVKESVREMRIQHALNACDPDWKRKAATAKRRLVTACYRWQLGEFGDATKAFRVDIKNQGGRKVFADFHPEIDTDWDAYLSMSPEDADAYVIGLESDVSMLKPRDEASLARLHAALDQVVEENTGRELFDLLVTHGKLRVSTSDLSFI